MAAACFTVIAVLLGVHTGYRTVDVDEVVFHRTIVAMRAGAARSYWGLAFGPALACFVPAGLGALERYRARTSARNLPV